MGGGGAGEEGLSAALGAHGLGGEAPAALGGGRTGPGGESGGAPPPARRERPSGFDMARYRQRRVALHVLYFGQKFQGLAMQKHTQETVEGQLLVALHKTRLKAPETAPGELLWSRCGRTDKGVSAYDQVVSLLLRSKVPPGAPVTRESDEIDYPRIMNRFLPDDIRVAGWAPVAEDFDARYSCLGRHYKYFFVQQGGEFDLAAMRTACALFEGSHDFRNFCQKDVTATHTFCRSVSECFIEPVDRFGGPGPHGMEVFAINVKGKAFLWHQVRCMAAVLFMVGRGQEEPEIVSRLLDVEAHPGKPHYRMAPEGPLVLFRCAFKDLEFIRTPEVRRSVQASVDAQLKEHLLQTCVWKCFSESLREEGAGGGGGGSGGDVNEGPPKKHRKLLARGAGPSVENLQEKAGLRGRLPGQQDASRAAGGGERTE